MNVMLQRGEGRTTVKRTITLSKRVDLLSFNIFRNIWDKVITQYISRSGHFKIL